MRKEARDNLTSINTVVNQVLYAHFFDERPVLKPGFVGMPTQVLGYIMSKVTDEEATEIGRQLAKGAGKSWILRMHGEINTETIAELLRDFARRAGYGDYTDVRNSERIITITHELGARGSIMIAALAETLFQMIDIRPKVTTTEEAVVVLLKS
jgi:hypothetical protein